VCLKCVNTCINRLIILSKNDRSIALPLSWFSRRSAVKRPFVCRQFILIISNGLQCLSVCLDWFDCWEVPDQPIYRRCGLPLRAGRGTSPSSTWKSVVSSFIELGSFKSIADRCCDSNSPPQLKHFEILFWITMHFCAAYDGPVPVQDVSPAAVAFLTYADNLGISQERELDQNAYSYV
jgi:hypothetical protein